MGNARGRELQGRIALITGAVRRIGRAIALALADEGAAVVIDTRRSQGEAEAGAAEIEAVGALMHLADVADETAMQTMVEAALALGRIAMLIDNAADRQQTPLTEISPAEWRHITGIIVDGAFLCVRPWRAAYDRGRRRDGGQHRRRKRAHGRTQSRLSSPLNRTTRGRDRWMEWIQWCEPPTRFVLRIGPPATN
jgi:3-oxoacyl-[acyl-carrier protein] reductase